MLRFFGLKLLNLKGGTIKLMLLQLHFISRWPKPKVDYEMPSMWEWIGVCVIKCPAKDTCLCMEDLQAPAAPHFVFLITL